jgi:Fic family protein
LSDSLSQSNPPSHTWSEIDSLQEDLMTFRDRELESLKEVWTEQRGAIGDKARQFMDRLKREWSIETGIIEGAYDLDRGITETLIERGIDSAYIPHDATHQDPELVARIIQAHHETLEGLFAFVTGERNLSTGYIKELHAALLRYTDTITVFDQFGEPFQTALRRGEYKALPNNPRRPDGSLHEYCPPEHVASEMDRLIQMHELQTSRGVLPHVESAWLHHAFTQIHPFQDGNGRVARAIATLVFIKADLFPLVINRSDRSRYITALESADQGDLSDLVRLFSQVQKRALTKAIGTAVDVKPVSSVEEAIKTTVELLVSVGAITSPKYESIKAVGAKLAGVTTNRFNQVVNALSEQVTRVNRTFTFKTGSYGGPPKDDLEVLAAQYHYDPNTASFHNSLLLTFSNKSPEGTEITSNLVVSFHGVGAAFRGLLVAVSYFKAPNKPPKALSEDLFRMVYDEPEGQIQQRFMEWIEGCMVNGIAEWRRSLV